MAEFGTLPDGRAVHRYVLGRGDGVRVELLDLGATVNGVRLRGDDPTTEVAIGFDDLATQRAASSAYFGAVVGRYANRIADASFSLDGTTHRIVTASPGPALHGGREGFDSRLWTLVERADDALTFELVSPDGDQGFPGELTARARYSILDDGFALDLSATTTAPTVCWLTSHLYVNLNGAGTVEDDLLQVEADQYVPVDADSIPLGELAGVGGTAFDLRTPRRIGDAVRSPDAQIGLARGIDHSFAIRGEGLRPAATVTARSGRTLTLLTDQPGLQVYTGNFLDGSFLARGGRRLRQGDALALEPQQHPDAPNQGWEPSAVLRPGQTWTSRTEWRFA